MVYLASAHLTLVTSSHCMGTNSTIRVVNVTSMTVETIAGGVGEHLLPTIRVPLRGWYPG